MVIVMVQSYKQRWHRRRYLGRLRAGLCPVCGGGRTGIWIVCIECRDKCNERRRSLSLADKRGAINRYRARCRRNGICYGCGREVLEDYKKCDVCRLKDKVLKAAKVG